MTDRDEEFEFKPLTEGLGFHKKAEKIKHDVKSSNLGAGSVRRPSSHAAAEQPMRSSMFAPKEIELPPQEISRPASQSISELIASLPPSLDFIEDKNDPMGSGKSSMSASSMSTSSMGGSAAGSSKGSGKFSPSFESKFEAKFEANDSYSDRPQIFQPLGRDDYKSSSGPTVGSRLPAPGSKAGGMSPSVPIVPAIPVPTTSSSSLNSKAAVQPSSPYRERMDESFARAFPHAEQKQKDPSMASDLEGSEALEPTSVHLASGVLDGMVVAGVSTILLVVILAITRINLVGLLSNVNTNTTTQINLALLFICVSQIYLLVARSFFGASLGEWAFDLQMGTDKDRRTWTYPLRVAWRTLLVTITGVIVFPILSAITKRDLASRLTGLQLYLRP